MSEHSFDGPFADSLRDFLSAKRAAGRKYGSELRLLDQMGRFFKTCRIERGELSRQHVEAWIERRNGERPRTQNIRCTIIRQFAIFLRQRGGEAWVPPPRWGPPDRRVFSPYIFTHKEVRRFFDVIDHLEPHRCSARYHVAMPLLFRLLYCCGLRLGEALRLTPGDVNLSDGILTMRNSKFGKDRMIPVLGAIRERLAGYVELRQPADSRSPLFMSCRKRAFHPAGVSAFHIRTVRQAGIPHRGRGDGPRVHDWRHTFAVHRLEEWIREGLDFTARLPALSAYLGHKDLHGTQLYLRLTAEVFPDLSKNMDALIGSLIEGRDRDEA